MSYLDVASRELWELLLLGALVMLWWLFFFEYTSYRVDLLRQRLFELRARLFVGSRDQLTKRTIHTDKNLVAVIKQQPLDQHAQS